MSGGGRRRGRRGGRGRRGRNGGREPNGGAGGRPQERQQPPPGSTTSDGPQYAPRPDAARRPRLNSRQRAALYPVAAAQQGGEYCVHCSRTPQELAADGESNQLCLDHVNNDPADNRRLNLQLLCKSCNTRKNHPAEPGMARRLRPPSVEIQLNRSYEPNFRRWLSEQFQANENLQYPTDQVVADGAEYTGASVDTIEKYVLKVTSRYGMYDELGPLVSGGKKFVILRPEYRNNSTGTGTAAPSIVEPPPPTEAAAPADSAQATLDAASDSDATSEQ